MDDANKEAGAAGIEPAVAVLETAGLPLTDAPIDVETGHCSVSTQLLFRFFVRSVLVAKFAMFLQLQFTRLVQLLFILFGVMGGFLALLALHFYQIIL